MRDVLSAKTRRNFVTSRTQRDLDEEEEIPPLDAKNDEHLSSSHGSSTVSDEQEEENISDTRPLTALEDPFGLTFERRHSKEEEKSEVIIPPIELCQPSFEEVSELHSQTSEEEILPPLASLSLALERINDPEALVLPSEEELLLSSVRTFELEDILGNKTLLKQVRCSTLTREGSKVSQRCRPHYD